jgi:hypothetical protein
VKMYLTNDEWYPVYGLSTENRYYLTQYVVDVSEEMLEKVKKLEKDFEEMQTVLEKLPKVKILPFERV